MNPRAANEYLKAKVMTATPEQLQMLLYDGAVRFCEQGLIALDKNDFEASHNALTRAQKILLELHAGLKKDIAPELCKNLGALYMWCYRRLIDANTQRDRKAVEEALQILKYQRETWAMLMEQLGRRNATAAAQKLDLPAPDERMEARFVA
jgi:flagellar protein FliS